MKTAFMGHELKTSRKFRLMTISEGENPMLLNYEANRKVAGSASDIRKAARILDAEGYTPIFDGVVYPEGVLCELYYRHPETDGSRVYNVFWEDGEEE